MQFPEVVIYHGVMLLLTYPSMLTPFDFEHLHLTWNWSSNSIWIFKLSISIFSVWAPDKIHVDDDYSTLQAGLTCAASNVQSLSWYLSPLRKQKLLCRQVGAVFSHEHVPIAGPSTWIMLCYSDDRVTSSSSCYIFWVAAYFECSANRWHFFIPGNVQCKPLDFCWQALDL
jgi:hypothetical protein